MIDGDHQAGLAPWFLDKHTKDFLVKLGKEWVRAHPLPLILEYAILY